VGEGMTIPRIIHQTWKDERLPVRMQKMAASWKRNHPGWEYRLWTDLQNREFVMTHYPHFLMRYDSYPYDIQRVDAVRYLFLYTFGGIYVDLDFECLHSLERLLKDQECLFGLEPQEHCQIHNRDRIIGNALMATVPQHSFFRAIIQDLTDHYPLQGDANNIVLETTGPFMLTRVYDRYRPADVALLSNDHVYPLSVSELERAARKGWSEADRQKLGEAYAVHYFAATWWNGQPGTWGWQTTLSDGDCDL